MSHVETIQHALAADRRRERKEVFEVIARLLEQPLHVPDEFHAHVDPRGGLTRETWREPTTFEAAYVKLGDIDERFESHGRRFLQKVGTMKAAHVEKVADRLQGAKRAGQARPKNLTKPRERKRFVDTVQGFADDLIAFGVESVRAELALQVEHPMHALHGQGPNSPEHGGPPREGRGGESAFESARDDLKGSFPDLDIWLSRDKRFDREVWVLSKVVVPEEERGQGIGSRFMRQLIEAADAAGAELHLTADTSFGATSKKRLEKFYERFGFVANRGPSKDFQVSEGMIRAPRARLSDHALALDDEDVVGAVVTGPHRRELVNGEVEQFVSINVDEILANIETVVQKAFENAIREGQDPRGAADSAVEEVNDTANTILKRVGREIASHALNGGRNIGAAEARDDGLAVHWARRVSVLEPDVRCGPCKRLDGFTTRIDSPQYEKKNPPAQCLGQGACRCFWIYGIGTPDAPPPEWLRDFEGPDPARVAADELQRLHGQGPNSPEHGGPPRFKYGRAGDSRFPSESPTEPSALLVVKESGTVDFDGMRGEDALTFAREFDAMRREHDLPQLASIETATPEELEKLGHGGLVVGFRTRTHDDGRRSYSLLVNEGFFKEFASFEGWIWMQEARGFLAAKSVADLALHEAAHYLHRSKNDGTLNGLIREAFREGRTATRTFSGISDYAARNEDEFFAELMVALRHRSIAEIVGGPEAADVPLDKLKRHDQAFAFAIKSVVDRLAHTKEQNRTR